MSMKVNVVDRGKKTRALDFEPQIGDEIYNSVTGLQAVTRKVYDEEANEVIVYMEPSPNPYP